MRDVLRRNTALLVLGAMGFAALLTTMFTGGVSRAAYTGCGFGYDPSSVGGDVGYGYGYGYGYGTCPGGGGGGGGGATTTSSTSTTSTTSPTGPPPQVISGTNREGTAVAASQATFPNPGSAKAVILTRDDLFPDALGGSRLAVVKDGPLLLTPSTSLDPSTEAEIKRVLPAGGTVFVLGGTEAIVPAIVTQLQADGFTVIRIGGPDRFVTAVDIANEDTNAASTSSAGGARIAAANGPAAPILIATGLDFPDGLAAGADASKIGAAVVLSNGSLPTPATTAYIQAHPGVPLYAVGGPAARAYPAATPIVGATRYETAVDLADQFFSSPSVVGIATGAQFPDALSGGAAMGEFGGPLLLTDPNFLSSATSGYLTANKSSIKHVYVFGGSAAVSQNDLNEIAAAQA